MTALCRLLAAAALGCVCAAPLAAQAAEPLDIAVMVSSDKNRCYDPATVKAIKQLATAEAGRINAAGGAGGHALQVQVLDDFEVPETATDNLGKALADPRLVAIVGLASSSRAKAALAVHGKALRDAGVPMLSEISLSSLLADQPAMYSMASTVDTELQVVKRFAHDRGIAKAAFLGLAGDDYSMALGDGLGRGADAVMLAADHRLPLQGSLIEAAALTAAVSNVKQQGPDVLFLAVQSGPGAQVMKALAAAGVDVPVFVLYGRAKRILDLIAPLNPDKEVLELGRDGVPEAYNERLQQQIWRSGGAGWIFEDTPNKATPGWSDGSCTLTKSSGPPRILDERNRRAIGRGAQYADMIALIGDALAGAVPDADVASLRARVASRLAELSTGRSTFQGLWQNWSFTKGRASADDALILQRLPGQASLTLAPVQYHRVGDSLEPTPVIQLALDPISLSRVDTNDATFEAELYLSLRSSDASLGIETVEFTNAAHSPASEEKLVRWRQIHDGSAGSSFPAGVKVYKVVGKFTFAPELGAYPFDSQRLSVSFQPVSTSRPFLVQPMPASAATGQPTIDGFDLRDSYVGIDEDFVPTLDPVQGGRQVVSFYKFNETWVVHRQAVDFYLRVLVPLGFILLVTWFSVFLSPERFESIMGIQVTALLSSIALYLALPRIDTTEPTLYEKVFMLTYAAVSSMIGLTVLHDRWLGPSHGWTRQGIGLLQRAMFPLAVIAAAAWIVLINTKG